MSAEPATNVRKAFFDFKPLGALLDPRTESLFSHHLQETVDRVLIIRAASGSYDTEPKHILRFVSVLNRFEEDEEFGRRILDRVRESLDQLEHTYETLATCNRLVIEGDWGLKWELRSIVEEAAQTWLKQSSSLVENGRVGKDDESRFGIILREKLRDLDTLKRHLLHRTPEELGNDKYLVYFLDLEKAIPPAIRGHLHSIGYKQDSVESLTQRILHLLKERTSLLSAEWALSSPRDTDLDTYVCDQLQRQIFELLIGDKAGIYSFSPTEEVPEIIGAYSKAKRALQSIRSVAYTPDEAEMSRVRNRWALHEQYKDIVFSTSFLEAPLVPDTRQILSDYLGRRIAQELSRKTIRRVGAPDSLDLAGSLAMQRTARRALGDLWLFYADATWPGWRTMMASYPDQAIQMVLAVVIPAIISGSVEAYIGWRLTKRLQEERRHDGAPAGDTDSCEAAKESIRVLSFVCEELLRYKYYIFDAADLRRARDSSEALVANLAYLAEESKKLEDPMLTADLENLGRLLSEERAILNRRRSKKDRVNAILGRRKLFARQVEAMSVLRNRASEIVQEHMPLTSRVYDRAASTLFELRAIADLDNGTSRTIAQETASRIVSINAPYILGLTIKHFLSSRGH
jgi:hypothetical protein